VKQPLIGFEWSAQKAALNLGKHGVSFEEAETVFEDATAFTQLDELHSDQETREWLIGHSGRRRLLIVAFVQRDAHRIRIISARRATRRERSTYEEKQRG
jgi:uncharacterized DUF497 family protein